MIKQETHKASFNKGNLNLCDSTTQLKSDIIAYDY